MKENEYVSIKNFIDWLLKKEIKLIIPPLQRPITWNSKKIASLIEDVSDEYFGNILFYKGKSEKEWIVIDGQQRLVTFILIYKKLYNIDVEEFVVFESNPDERQLFKCIFGNSKSSDHYIHLLENKTTKENVNEFNELKEKLTGFALFNHFKIIFSSKIDQNILEKKIISWVKLDKGSHVDKHDLFIGINNTGVKLAPSDIVKTTFLKYYKQKEAPIEIDKSWQEVLTIINSSKKETMDGAITSFLLSRGKKVTKSKIVKHFTDEIKESADQSKYIETTIMGISKYVSHYVEPQNYTEKKVTITKVMDEQRKAFKAFALSKIYKPLLPRMIGIFEKNKGHQSTYKLIEESLWLVIHSLNNKMMKVHKKGSNLMPFDIQERSLRFRKKTDTRSFVENVFDNQKIIEETFTALCDQINKSFYHKDYGKTLRAMFEYFHARPLSFKMFHSESSVEHVKETIILKNNKKILKKTNANEYMFFIEEELHNEINNRVKKEVKTQKNKKIAFEKLYIIKNEIYKKSKFELTKSVSIHPSSKKMKISIKEYFDKKNMKWIKEKYG